MKLIVAFRNLRREVKFPSENKNGRFLGRFKSIGEDHTELYLTEIPCDFVWT